jgi:hypothetical protein
MLLEMRAIAARAGTEFLVVLADGFGRRGGDLEGFLERKRVRVLNLEESFAGSFSEALHLPDGVHWNEMGHRRVATRLVEYLASVQGGPFSPPSGRSSVACR